MKKIMSVMLAVMMLLSCFSAVTANAEGGIADMLFSAETLAQTETALSYFTVKELPGHIEDFNKFKTGSQWSNVSLMGIDLDFLYSNTEVLKWADLDVFAKDENGKIIYAEDGLPVMLVSKDDIGTAFSNIGTYLQQVFYNRYGGLNMYTVENLVSLVNIIGNIFQPNFKKLNPVDYKNYFNNEIPSTNEFYRAVAKLSGLDVIIGANWVPRGKNYCEATVKVLGGYYINFLDYYYTDGLVLSSKLLEGMVKKLVAVGPIDFAYDIIKVFTTPAYNATHRAPVLALFTRKIPVIGSHVTESELNTFNGLLQLVFCNEDCYVKDDSAAVKFCPMDFPSERIGATTDKDESLIYIYYYLNLCGRYKDNAKFFENVITSLRLSDEFSADDKKKLESIIDAFFIVTSETFLKDAAIPLYKVNVSDTTSTLSDRMKNAFMTLLKKIADYFDYLRKIFSGELQYGQGNSPFN